MSVDFASTEQASIWLKRWLVETSFPVWANAGVDHDRGGFFEKLADDYSPSNDARRTRVVGRQIFCFARAGSLGWKGDGCRLVNHGLDFLVQKSLSPDCIAYSSVDPEGHVIRSDFDLYDQAFALFGLAEAANILPDRREWITDTGRRLRDRMIAGWRHPEFGFEETRPRRVPLLANPHMHLLEAFLSWMNVDPDDRTWSVLADEIAHLAMERLIDPQVGFLREYFDGDWRPYPGDLGRIVEPGHQFEWAWLLCRWGRGKPDALRAARRLCQIGEDFGIALDHDFAIGELSDDLVPQKLGARIWAQCERIKAHVAMAEIAETKADRVNAENRIKRAVTGLRPFLTASAPGLWRDRRHENGSFAIEHAPASSLYHIVFAACELDRYVQS